MAELPTTVAGLVSILQKTRKEKDLATAVAVFIHARKLGMVSQTAVGNHLVSTLAGCGALAEANQVFDNLPYRNERSWTSLLSCYMDRCEPQRALSLYKRMQDDHVAPTTFTLVFSLKACAELKELAGGQQIHIDIVLRGCEKHVFVGNALVDMYAKCGSFTDAVETLANLHCRDVVTWTAVINGHVEHGRFNVAVSLLGTMHEDGVFANNITFICILRAVAGIGSLCKGHEIHTQIILWGLERDSTVGNTLVFMYGKCGSLSCAQDVFNKLSYQDGVSWNALIAAYAEHDSSEDVVKAFEQMQVGGVSPNAVTFNCALKASGSLKFLELGQRLHADVVAKGIKDGIVGNAVVEMYSKCNMMHDAEDALLALPFRDVVSWNTVILGYAEQASNEHAFQCFQKMQEENFAPDSVTYVSVLKICNAHRGASHMGQYIHKGLTLLGCEQDVIVGSALVDMYSKVGMLAEAQKIFDRLSSRHVPVWSALLAGYSEHGSCSAALKFYSQMLADGIAPDAGIFVCLLKAFKGVGALSIVHDVHSDIFYRGYDLDVLVSGILVDIYVNHGAFEEAQKVFHVLPFRDVVTWSTLIRGCGVNQQRNSVVKFFENMQDDGVELDNVTFMCLLSACSRTQLISEGQEFFSAMSSKHGFVPTSEHYACVVDLLAKSGYLDEARKYLEGSEPCPPVLTSLLTACKSHGDNILGQNCFQRLAQ